MSAFGGGFDMGGCLGSWASIPSTKMADESEVSTEPAPPQKPFREAVADVYRHFQRDLSNRETIVNPSSGAIEPLDKSVKEQVSGELADAIARNDAKKAWPVRAVIPFFREIDLSE